jgi:hypothetical protein
VTVIKDIAPDKKSNIKYNIITNKKIDNIFPEFKTNDNYINNTNKIGKIIFKHLIYNDNITFLKEVLNITVLTPYVWHFGIIYSLLNGKLEMFNLFKSLVTNLNISWLVHYAVYHGNWNFIDTIFANYKLNEISIHLSSEYITNANTLHWYFYKCPENITNILLKELQITSANTDRRDISKWIAAHSSRVYIPLLSKCILNWSKKFNKDGFGTDISKNIANYLYVFNI